MVPFSPMIWDGGLVLYG